MIKAYFRLDANEIEKRLGSLYAKAPVVMSRAANRSVGTVRKDVKKEATRRYKTTSTDVGKTIGTKSATRAFPYAIIAITDKHINLARFRVTPNHPVQLLEGRERNPKAYRASVKKGQADVALTKGNKPFIAVMKSGHVGMFRRTSPLRSAPIKGVSGPSTPQMIQNTEVMHVIEENAADMMQKRVEHEISRVLEGGG